MLLDRKFRTCLITFILMISSLSIVVLIPEHVGAESSGNTVLYFHESFMGMDGVVDEIMPTGENDSMWPPRLSNNPNEWLEWIFLWYAFEQMKDSLNETEFGQTDELLELLGVGNPYKLSESYEYDGEEILGVKGNIDFNLYFGATVPSKIYSLIPESVVSFIPEEFCVGVDDVKVGLNINMGEQKYNATGRIDLKLRSGKIQKLKLTIENVDFDIYPGDVLTFSVEIIPSEKLLAEYVGGEIDDDAVKSNLENLSEWIINESAAKYPMIRKAVEKGIDRILEKTDVGLNVSELKNLAVESIDGLLEYGEGENVSEWIVEILTTLRSSYFVYNSADYPSSITLPTRLFEGDENTKTYYLHSENKMDESSPDSDSSTEADLSKGPVKWDSLEFERSKILKKATANVYINHRDLNRLLNLGKTKLVAKLICGDEEIATSEKDLDKQWSYFLNILKLKTPEPISFTFDSLEEKGYEISYGRPLSLEVSVGNGTRFGLLGIYKSMRLYYDSVDYPSSLFVVYGETDHIKVSDITKDPSDGKIVAGGSIVYRFNVTSDYEDEIEIITEGFSTEEDEKWDIEIPDEFTISDDGKESVEILVTSTEEDIEAYGDILDVTFAAAGKTGKDSFDASVEISDDAVEYDIEVTSLQVKEIKHGRNGTYVFTIKNLNTGFWPDDYKISASSENNFTLDIIYDKNDLKDVETGEEIEIQITVYVPKYTDISSDILTIYVTSEESKAHGKEKIVSAEVTTTIVTPNILEKIYQFFEVSADNLGLAEVFGSYAPHTLAAILLLVIFFILVTLVIFIKRKYLEIMCLDRIKEITPDEEAKYEISIRNPSKSILNYELKTEEVSPSPGWGVTLDTDTLTIESKQEQKVILTVKPTDFAKPDDWTEVKLIATVVEKQKSDEISTVTSIKDGKIDLSILGVFHWPSKFKKGEKVKTSFKLKNDGNASANNVSVILYVNGEEKNKVEGIAIPRGGYADIEMPWIAEKGKNTIDIVLK